MLVWDAGQLSGVCFCIALSLQALFIKTPDPILPVYLEAHSLPELLPLEGQQKRTAGHQTDTQPFSCGQTFTEKEDGKQRDKDQTKLVYGSDLGDLTHLQRAEVTNPRRTSCQR